MNINALLKKWSESRIWDVLWAVFVALLPFTSVPLIVKLVHSDVVAAPSALILPVFLAAWVFPKLILGKTFPESSKPLILFALTSILLTLISFFYNIPEYKGHGLLSPTISSILTLCIGLGFYLIALFFHDSDDRLRFTGKLLDLSGLAICLWTLLQAFCWYRFKKYPNWMKEIQFVLSVGSLYRQRFVGFALEPSWLAHQLNLLWLPWWFAASLTGASAFKRRWKFFTVERILFPMGVLVLFLSLSRVGLGAFLLTVFFVALILVYRFVQQQTAKISNQSRKSFYTFGAFFLVLLGIGSIGFLILWLLTKLDFRMANLFNIDFIGRSDPVFYLAEKLSLAARFVYWDAGIGIFNAHPIAGVGLGHAGFYIPDHLNEYAFRLVEVRDLLYNSQTLLNIKSFWIRILAETGIIGFCIFLVWYLCSYLRLKPYLKFDASMKSTAAWMGCFTLIAFLMEGFSLDTFALPYFWFSLGIANSIGNTQ